ncbi:MAG: hypothetical protein LBH29_03115 [Elusimicrobiota bacterium]|jgi:hypothetical protein|nr:hypothetical protein [Elusimicrobiota bacterium]
MAGENLIYDYALKVEVKDGVAGADTGFLRMPLVVVRPKDGFTQTGQVITALKTTIADITDNPNVVKIFDGGCPRILVIATNTLESLKDIYEDHLNDFYTLIISRDFEDAEIKEYLDVGNFKGVVFHSTDTAKNAADTAKMKLRGAYYQDEGNMFYAWGKFLSAIDWNNLQYQELINDDGVINAAEAENLFADRVSFSLKDSQSVNRLAFFSQGGEAIIAPYVIKEIELKLQSETVNWINLNNPQYTNVDCSILAQYLQGKVVNDYIGRRLITEGSVEITTENGSNFIAAGKITIPKPTALWRIKANLYNA